MEMILTSHKFHGTMTVIVGGMMKWKMLKTSVIQFGWMRKIHFLFYTQGMFPNKIVYK